MEVLDSVLLDTGPLVAYLKANDLHHQWSRSRFATITGDLITCEAVLTEASHLLRRDPEATHALNTMLARGVFVLPFRLSTENGSVAAAMLRYHDLPMSPADACLVRMSELHPTVPVLTIDSHFRVYRRTRHGVIPLIFPEKGGQ